MHMEAIIKNSTILMNLHPSSLTTHTKLFTNNIIEFTNYQMQNLSKNCEWEKKNCIQCIEFFFLSIYKE